MEELRMQVGEKQHVKLMGLTRSGAVVPPPPSAELSMAATAGDSTVEVDADKKGAFVKAGAAPSEGAVEWSATSTDPEINTNPTSANVFVEAAVVVGLTLVAEAPVAQ